MAKRDPFQPSEVVSRRGGRVKQPLSRDAIVTTALALLRRDGLDGMSLRRVAAELDTGPASLYAYVDDLDELQALVLDRALAGVATTGSRSRSWRGRLKALLESYAAVLVRNPGLAELAMTTIAAGPNALRFIEAQLSLLDEAGVDSAAAAWAVDLITLNVTALCVEQTYRQGDPFGPITKVVGAVSALEHPRVHASRDELLSGNGDARFAWYLDVILNGVLETPRAKTAR